ncbi:MAG: hypothetical protein RLZZ165_754 [Bacteroidota bacterium]|jgi:hypothetical protein
MKKYSLMFPLVLVVNWFCLTGCKPDKPVDPNEEELITKVVLTFTDSVTGALAKEVIYSDPDGDGGNGPVRFDSIVLDSGGVYDVRITLLDESDANDIHNISDEVRAEGDEHLFCYAASGVNVMIQLTDSDGNFPVGITSVWRALDVGTGTVSVELRHQPDGTKNGTCIPGSTDLKLGFHLSVQ